MRSQLTGALQGDCAAASAHQRLLQMLGPYGKLRQEFPGDYQMRVERLSEYMASTGRIYKNHLATIRSWAKRDEEKAKGGKPAKQYDHGNYQFAAGDSL